MSQPQQCQEFNQFLQLSTKMHHSLTINHHPQTSEQVSKWVHAVRRSVVSKLRPTTARLSVDWETTDCLCNGTTGCHTPPKYTTLQITSPSRTSEHSVWNISKPVNALNVYYCTIITFLWTHTTLIQQRSNSVHWCDAISWVSVRASSLRWNSRTTGQLHTSWQRNRNLLLLL